MADQILSLHFCCYTISPHKYLLAVGEFHHLQGSTGITLLSVIPEILYFFFYLAGTVSDLYSIYYIHSCWLEDFLCRFILITAETVWNNVKSRLGFKMPDFKTFPGSILASIKKK